MNIALISEHASPAALLGGEDAGGQNVYVDQVARGLAALGHRVDVFTRRDRADAPRCVAWAPGVRIVNLVAGPPRSMPKDDLWPLMPAFRDDLLRFVMGDGIRYDVVHGNFWMSGWVAMELRRALGVPAVQLFHALGASKRRHQGAADTSPAPRIVVERRIANAVDRVIATCPRERAELIADYGAPPARIETIPLGVCTATLHPVDRNAARRRIGLGLGEHDRVVVYVGRLVPRKDVRNAVRALALLVRQEASTNAPPVKLLVVGGASRVPDPAVTPEIQALRRLAAELEVGDRLILAGERTQSELPDYYGAGDIAVSTPWYEPFGLTPLEAMACGRPVVGSDVGGIAHTVRHGETGLLVPPRDPAALAQALADLLADPIRRDQMGAAARRRVEHHFTWPIVASRTAALYEALCAGASDGAHDRSPIIVVGDPPHEAASGD